MKLDLPSLEDVERRLELARPDRGRLPGLYRMNVIRLPLIRLVGFVIALVMLGAHNRAVFGAIDWPGYLSVAAVVVAYCLLSWAILLRWFARFESFHLGDVFVWLDLLGFTAIVYASGAEQSLLWPIYFVRVADQIWISRRRAVAAALGGILCLALLLAWIGAVEGRPLDWGVEGTKLLALAAMSAALAAVATQPWDVQARTTEARDLIMQLEAQSLELDLARERAEAASRAKSDFLARMSHELRTPLNAVVGFTSILLKKSDGREREYLTRIRDNGVHLLGLIDDILDFARIGSGRIEIELHDVDIGQLVRDTVHQLEGKAFNTGVTLAHHVPLGLAPLRADDARLRQVLIHLVVNALKFTERGRVDVEIEVDATGRVAERVRVRDTGIGITADRLQDVSDPFEQADGTTSRKYGGTGLGLAVSRSLCEVMGFELSVESEIGRGSVFTVSFRPEAPTPPAERPA